MDEGSRVAGIMRMTLAATEFEVSVRIASALERIATALENPRCPNCVYLEGGGRVLCPDHDLLSTDPDTGSAWAPRA